MSRMVQALQLVAWRESRRKAARAKAQRPVAPAPAAPVVAKSQRTWRIDTPPTVVELPRSQAPLELEPEEPTELETPDEAARRGAGETPTPKTTAKPQAAGGTPTPRDTGETLAAQETLELPEDDSEDVYLVEEPVVLVRAKPAPLVEQIRVPGPSDPFLGVVAPKAVGVQASACLDPRERQEGKLKLELQRPRIDAGAIDLPREAKPKVAAAPPAPAPAIEAIVTPEPEIDPLAAFAAAGSLDVLLPTIQATNSMMTLALQTLPARAIGPPLVATMPFSILPEIDVAAVAGVTVDASLETLSASHAETELEQAVRLEALSPAIAKPNEIEEESLPVIFPPELLTPKIASKISLPVMERPMILPLVAAPRATARNERAGPLEVRFSEITVRQTRNVAASTRLNLAHLEEPLAGQFRELADNLVATLPTDRPTSVLFTACEANGQLSEVLAQLARQLAADQAQPTLLVDVQSGPQSLTHRLGLDALPGWGEIVANETSAIAAGVATEIPLLHILPHGRAVGSPGTELEFAL